MLDLMIHGDLFFSIITQQNVQSGINIILAFIKGFSIELEHVQ